jgi:hypothetical protein
MRYFLPISASLFEELLVPALSQSRKQRSFGPVLGICRDFAARARILVQHAGSETIPPVTLQVPDGLAFRRGSWSLLAGELLLLAAAELPQIEAPLESLASVLDQPLSTARGSFPPIQQAIAGSRDLWFGGSYRPQSAGWNDVADVGRLASWLASVDRDSWSAGKLSDARIANPIEELEFLKEWLPPLCEMYRRAADMNWIMVCEEI